MADTYSLLEFFFDNLTASISISFILRISESTNYPYNLPIFLLNNKIPCVLPDRYLFSILPVHCGPVN